jgi:hypothetical protein
VGNRGGERERERDRYTEIGVRKKACPDWENGVKIKKL